MIVPFDQMTEGGPCQVEIPPEPLVLPTYLCLLYPFPSPFPFLPEQKG